MTGLHHIHRQFERALSGAPHGIAPRQKVVFDPVPQIPTVRLRQHSFVYHLTAQHLNFYELSQDLLPGGVADLHFQTIHNRVDVFAGVRQTIEVTEPATKVLDVKEAS